MRAQRLIWTALPNGFSSDGLRLRLSVHVSPRLATDEALVLSTFPDFVNWAGTAVTFKVHVGPLALDAAVVSPARRTDLWSALFPANTPIRSYVFPSYSGRRVKSYPAANVRAYLRDFYLWALQNHPSDFPSLTDLVGRPDLPGGPPPVAGRLDAIRFGLRPGGGATIDTEQAVEAQIESALTAQKAIPAGPPSPASDLIQLKRFHRRDPVTSPPPPPAVPDIDFHQMVGLLGDHPHLQRLLGLVFDLEVPWSSGAPQSPLWVKPTWVPDFFAHPVAGRTNVNVMPFTVTTAAFRAASRPTDTDQVDGFLRMEDPNKFSVVELDIDTPSLQLLDQARSLDRIVYGIDGQGGGSPRTPFTPDTSSAPALRTGGLTIARTGRASSVVSTATLADANNAKLAATPPLAANLYAEDLTRGWRLDVWDSVRNRWFQLCARSNGSTGGYRIGTGPIVVPVPAGDEGWVQFGVSSGQIASSPDLSAPESTSRWQGWSLVAPRPGKVLSTAPTAPLKPSNGNPAATFFKLETSYAATPGTLPMLRFGRRYRFRARAVDVAGNSVAFDPAATVASFAHATPAVTYGRFEPVPTPTLLMRKPVTESESGETIVIRSNYDVDDSTVVASERHVVPAMMSQLMAEEHGRWDNGAGTAPDPAKYATIVARDNKPLTSLTTDPANGGQPYFDTDTLNIPYLPDVLARGVALTGLPGGPPGGPLKVSHYDGTLWPAARGFRIKAIGGPAGIGAADLPTTGNGRQLTVRLPKATVASVRMSAYVDAPFLNSLGLWNWASKAGLATATLQTLTTNGGNWLITPYRTITFVHAVRQPLTPPQIGPLAAGRTVLGQTTADLAGAIAVHRASSGKIDVSASWSEPLDDPTLGPPSTRQVESRVGEIQLDPNDPAGDQVPLGATGVSFAHEFGDTRHRLVDYRSVATSRFVEYFRQQATLVLTGVAPTVVDAAGLVAGTDEVRSADGTIRYDRTADYVVDLVAGTLTRVASGAIPSGASVKVAYVAAPVTRSSLEQIVPPATSTGYPVSVPSSAPPLAVDLRRVVPSVSWSRGTTATGAQQTHRAGGGLRVFVGRPWFSSGEGELLGVLLPNFAVSPNVPVPAELTARGEDPLFANITAPPRQRGADGGRLPAGPGGQRLRRRRPVHRRGPPGDVRCGARPLVRGHRRRRGQPLRAVRPARPRALPTERHPRGGGVGGGDHRSHTAHPHPDHHLEAGPAEAPAVQPDRHRARADLDPGAADRGDLRAARSHPGRRGGMEGRRFADPAVHDDVGRRHHDLERHGDPAGRGDGHPPPRGARVRAVPGRPRCRDHRAAHRLPRHAPALTGRRRTGGGLRSEPCRRPESSVRSDSRRPPGRRRSSWCATASPRRSSRGGTSRWSTATAIPRCRRWAASRPSAWASASPMSASTPSTSRPCGARRRRPVRWPGVSASRCGSRPICGRCTWGSGRRACSVSG